MTQQQALSPPRTRLVRKPELQAITGLSDPTIYRLEKQGRFPQRVKIGGNSVAWIEAEIMAWIREKADDRNVDGGGE